MSSLTTAWPTRIIYGSADCCRPWLGRVHLSHALADICMYKARPTPPIGRIGHSHHWFGMAHIHTTNSLADWCGLWHGWYSLWYDAVTTWPIYVHIVLFIDLPSVSSIFLSLLLRLSRLLCCVVYAYCCYCSRSVSYRDLVWTLPSLWYSMTVSGFISSARVLILFIDPPSVSPIFLSLFLWDFEVGNTNVSWPIPNL